jgi:hypothetical protein
MEVQFKTKGHTMKLANSTILAVVIAGGFSLAAYVLGQTQLPTGAGATNPGQNVGGQQGQPLQNPIISKPQTSASPGGSVTPQEPKASKMSKPQMSASPGGSVTPQQPKASKMSKPQMSASPGGSVTPNEPKPQNP